ncbi:MAG: hypothetical protein V9E94_06645 [Microthrixaceae bacterium]
MREGIDFFPLTVDIEERMYAAGKIPGSFFRREGRAPESAILTCRLIDRPLRPSFPDGFRNEVHVVGTVLGADQVNPYDVLAINGASAALMISGMPFDGPIGAVRLAYDRGGQLDPAPHLRGERPRPASRSSSQDVQLDDGDVAVMMVEAGGTEAAWGMYHETAPPRSTRQRSLRHSTSRRRWIIRHRSSSSAALVAAVVAEARRDRDHGLRGPGRLHPRDLRRGGVARRSAHRRDHADRRQGRAQPCRIGSA